MTNIAGIAAVTPASTGTSPVEVWTLIVAGLAVVTTMVSAGLLRRTGKGTVKAAEKAAAAAETSAEAATHAAEASAKSAAAAETAAAQLDVWRQREESMRMLRWAVDNAVSKEPARSSAGQEALKALAGHNLVQPLDQDFIHAVIAGIVAPIAENMDEDADVFMDDGDDVFVDDASDDDDEEDYAEDYDEDDYGDEDYDED